MLIRNSLKASYTRATISNNNTNVVASTNFGRATLALGTNVHTNHVPLSEFPIVKKIRQFFKNHQVVKIKPETIKKPDGSKNIIIRNSDRTLSKVIEHGIDGDPKTERAFENGHLKTVTLLGKSEKIETGKVVLGYDSAKNKISETTLDKEGDEYQIDKFSNGKLTSRLTLQNGIHSTVFSDSKKPIGEVSFFTDRKNPSSIRILDSKENKTAQVFYDHGEIPTQIDKYNESGLNTEQISFNNGQPTTIEKFDKNLNLTSTSSPTATDAISIQSILDTAKQILNKALK